MAKCKYCGRDMTTSDGCSMDEVLIDYDKKGTKVWYPRIKVGDPGDMMGVQPGERCYDCNAAYGEYHHPGCDSETCPKCGGQMISCGCGISAVRDYKTWLKSIEDALRKK